ncbi:S-layer homology domain-containing protein [Patescibacteria group bacterium]|nr:S-layer homology domain-containing protein [Patescibacteria group bacterium]MBU1759056.1 S-layer homology domain-containing protein [Patescibacteria group bacterium]
MRLACQLGIMGINTDGTPNTHFNPNDTVDRAQFGTTLSRVIW